MIVEKLADELRTEFLRNINFPDFDPMNTWLAVARRAMQLLADKPVATREAVEKWWHSVRDDYNGKPVVTTLIAALAHFAPPRQQMMIETLPDDDAIRIEMARDPDVIAARSRGYNSDVIQACARAARRLANTPAPEVDPDAGAKTVLKKGWPDLRWEDATYAIKEGCKRLAAMEKGNHNAD